MKERMIVKMKGKTTVLIPHIAYGEEELIAITPSEYNMGLIRARAVKKLWKVK